MAAIRNVFALIGLLTVVGVAVLSTKAEPFFAAYQSFKTFEPEARDVYLEMAQRLVETGNAAEATVWKFKVEEDLSVEDVEETLRFVANEYNIKNVGELPLYQQVEAMTGEPFRFMKIYMFCNALTAAKMVDYSDAFSAYLPCRIALVEDKQGQLWIYTLNMDMMIYGGRPLPPELKAEALKVKEQILAIMKRGVSGEF